MHYTQCKPGVLLGDSENLLKKLLRLGRQAHEPDYYGREDREVSQSQLYGRSFQYLSWGAYLWIDIAVPNLRTALGKRTPDRAGAPHGFLYFRTARELT